MERNEYPALLPKWQPVEKTRVKQGSGLSKRFFDVKKDGSHGASKKGWSPVVKAFK